MSAHKLLLIDAGLCKCEPAEKKEIIINYSLFPFHSSVLLVYDVFSLVL